MKRLLIGLIIKLLAFYYRLVNYVKVSRGKEIISPSDVTIETSLVWRGKIAPKGRCFYIAKVKYKNRLFTQNVAINRRNVSLAQESILKYRAQRFFAETITNRINK